MSSLEISHLKPAYIVTGDEDLLVQEASDRVRALARAQGFGERYVYTASANRFHWEEVIAQIQSVSLFGDKQLIELRLPTGKPGKEGGAAIEQIAAKFEKAELEDSVLLFICPKLDKATQASRWWQALLKVSEVIRADKVERAALPAWIAKRLQAQDQSIAAGESTQAVLQFFADCVEGNLLAAHQELEKLSLLYGPGSLTFDQIRASVFEVARFDPFDLSAAILSGQLERTQRILDGLEAEGSAAVLVHWVLAEDIRTLNKLHAAKSAHQPLAEVLRAARAWGPKETLLMRALNVVNAKQAALWLQAAHEVDGVVKGLRFPHWPNDSWKALHRLASQVTRVLA